jgi:hypothetical protein
MVRRSSIGGKIKSGNARRESAMIIGDARIYMRCKFQLCREIRFVRGDCIAVQHGGFLGASSLSSGPAKPYGLKEIHGLE